MVMTPKECDQAVRLYRLGYSDKEVGRFFGKHRDTIRAVRHEEGVGRHEKGEDGDLFLAIMDGVKKNRDVRELANELDLPIEAVDEFYGDYESVYQSRVREYCPVCKRPVVDKKRMCWFCRRVMEWHVA